jgi:CHAT domain-containing protein
LQLPLPIKEPPRLTWCATGPLAFLLLHAAGCYNEPGPRVFDYVVSSYTPTLSALLDRSRPLTQFRGLLVVGQAATLPGTIIELDQIQKQAENIHFTRLDKEHATPTAVLEAIEQHSWVHLACHASQHATDPTKSAFQLHDGELDLGTLTKNSLKHAQFAFLSACETAMGDENLSEESVHLAAGVMMAGCPAVIASMWSIKDEDAPLVAKTVYAYLLAGVAPHSLKSAEALHAALGSLREKIGEAQFARWVPYIHIGH